MPRDLKEEYQHVLGDLRLNSFKNLSFDTRMKLAIVKRIESKPEVGLWWLLKRKSKRRKTKK